MQYRLNGAGNAAALAEMNVTPLVDVMLVLLIIFMVTTPLIAQEIRIGLPRGNFRVEVEPPRLRLRIEQSGAVFIDRRPISLDALDGLLRIEAQRELPPLIQLSTAAGTEYQRLMDVVATAKNAGLESFAFEDDGR